MYICICVNERCVDETVDYIPRLGERTIEGVATGNITARGRGEKDGVVEKQKKTVKCVEGERCLGFLPVATV